MTNHNSYLFAAAIQRCVWLQLYGYGTVVSNFKTMIWLKRDLEKTYFKILVFGSIDFERVNASLMIGQC